ncbi:MAG: LVIVD repeat-containing protein [Nitrospinales bacterium]
MKNLIYPIFILCLFLSSCSEDSFFSFSGNDSAPAVSKGGSTARFAIKDNHLYSVDNEHLSTFDISSENESVLLEKQHIGWGAETIFPFGDFLFLGTQTGVMIFDVSNPATPRFISEYNHIVACDPVVTNGVHAFLTLRTGTNCWRTVNELQVLDVQNINNPEFLCSFPLTNPRGLAIHDNYLYVCDDGVKVFDISDVCNIVEVYHIPDIPANDVIYHRDYLLVTADNGFYQFRASDLTQLSYYDYAL